MKKIKVLGKQNRQGTSKKTGNPYNMTIVHYLDDKAPYVIGIGAMQLILPGEQYSVDSIELNATYGVEFGAHGYIEDFFKIEE